MQACAALQKVGLEHFRAASRALPNSPLQHLRYIDQRQQGSELTPKENLLVRQHRLAALELRQKRFTSLGPMPTTPLDTWGWEKQKHEAETDIKLALEIMLLSVPGLDAAWQKHTEIERLKTVRVDILQSAITMLAQQPAGGAASSSSQTPGERLWQLPVHGNLLSLN